MEPINGRIMRTTCQRVSYDFSCITLADFCDTVGVNSIYLLL